MKNAFTQYWFGTNEDVPPEVAIGCIVVGVAMLLFMCWMVYINITPATT